MSFREELDAVLPSDLPHRDTLIDQSEHHLELIVEANRHFNLTRITTPREAAIKHVLDSVLPWRLFEGAEHVLDAGTGAGFPGIPLALVLPELRFTLCESIQKKARFVEASVSALGLVNVAVASVRAEDWLKTHPTPVITARAMAPLSRAVQYFAPAIKVGSRALLYKGPDAEAEIAEARAPGVRMQVLARYELPDQLGTRTVVELSPSGR